MKKDNKKMCCKYFVFFFYSGQDLVQFAFSLLIYAAGYLSWRYIVNKRGVKLIGSSVKHRINGNKCYKRFYCSNGFISSPYDYPRTPALASGVVPKCEDEYVPPKGVFCGFTVVSPKGLTISITWSLFSSI